MSEKRGADFRRWLRGVDWLPVVLVASVVILLGCAVYATGLVGRESDANEAEFMRECSAHELHYQCVAKWRAGESHETIVPMPIVVPVSR